MKKNDSLIGENDKFISVLEHSSQLAKLNKPVLILGERGTGKELIAERLHFLSHRWQEPLVTLNCAALNEQLIDSELFGHEAGSFTGAQKKHLGRFERADRGTLFLDEIGNTPTIVQEKLLRVIEYGELERVGGSQSLNVDVRLICATNEDLVLASQTGKFRADLLDRLAFDVIHIPPLRERGEDIFLLAQHFALSMSKELNWPYFPGFTDHAIEQLYEYTWPGNVRELKNAIERSLYRVKNHDELIDKLIINPFDKLSKIDEEPTLVQPFRSLDTLAKENSQMHSIEHVPYSNLTNEKGSCYKINAPIDWPIHFKQEISKHQLYLMNCALNASNFNQKKAAKLLNLTYDQFRALLKKHSKTEQ